MTIIEPHKTKSSYNSTVFMLVFALVAFVCLNIYFYNETVNLRHSISVASKNLQALQVSNAESRTRLYQLTDLSSLDAIAKSRGLVKERKPEYFENKSEALAVN